MKRALKLQAYREAAALLAADMDSDDLACDGEYSEEDASAVREFIRNVIAPALKKRGDAPGKDGGE